MVKVGAGSRGRVLDGVDDAIPGQSRQVRLHIQNVKQANPSPWSACLDDVFRFVAVGDGRVS